MRRWPWVTTALTLVLLLNPIGLDVIYAAFLSGEQLSRNIWQPLFLCGVALLMVIGLAECGIKWLITRRRVRALDFGQADGKTET